VVSERQLLDDGRLLTDDSWGGDVDCWLLIAGCSLPVGGSGKKGEDPFGTEAHVVGKFENRDEGTFFFSMFAADAGEQFSGRVAAHAGDVGDVFWINDNAVGEGCHGIQGFGFNDAGLSACC